MSGHSKWSTIKRHKAQVDKKRGNLFTKLANAITIAVKEGKGGDIGVNHRLKLAVEKAKEANMPRDKIEKAIDRGLGKNKNEAELTTVIYEGFGPEGEAIIIEAITDNKQRTSAAIKNVLNTHGGTLGGVGSVNYLFQQVGEIHVKKTVSQDQLLELAMDVGAIDISSTFDSYILITDPAKLHEVKSYLDNHNLTVTGNELIYKPITPLPLANQSALSKLGKLRSALEDLEDIQRTFANIGQT